MRDLIEPTAAEVEQARWALQYRYRQIAALNALDAASHRHHRRRRVTVDLAKVTAEAWGDALTEAEARQRIAEQQARMHGAGGLF